MTIHRNDRADHHSGDSLELSTAHRQWGTVAAVSLCGAVAGASLTEAIATVFTHAPHITALQPSAEPVAIVGAVVGLVAGLLLRGRVHIGDPEPVASASLDDEDLDDMAPILPLHPQSWVPVPSGQRAHMSKIQDEPDEDTAHERRVPLALHAIATHPQARRPRAVRRIQHLHPLDLRHVSRPPSDPSAPSASTAAR